MIPNMVTLVQAWLEAQGKEVTYQSMIIQLDAELARSLQALERDGVIVVNGEYGEVRIRLSNDKD